MDGTLKMPEEDPDTIVDMLTYSYALDISSCAFYADACWPAVVRGQQQSCYDGCTGRHRQQIQHYRSPL
jgi:hypothetical protein